MGTIHVAQIQRLRCYIEPAGATYFGIDHSGTLGDFFDVPAIEGSIEFKINPNNIDKKYLRQDRDQYAGVLLGVQTATLSFDLPWFFSTLRSVAGGTPVAIAETPTSKLLGAWLGGQAIGTSMDADASCTVSTIKTADYANAAEGCGIAWADTAGKMYARKVVQVDGSNDLILDQALPSAPVAADPVYRGLDLYPANRTTANVKSFQFLLEGANFDDDAWLCLGGQCMAAPQLTMKNSERPIWKFTFEFAKCIRKEALLSATNNVTYTNVKEIFVADGVFTAYGIDIANPYTPVAIKTNLAVSDATFDFGETKYMKLTSPGGPGGLFGYIIGGESPKASGKFTLPWEVGDEVFIDLYEAHTPITINMQVGSSETDGCGLITVQNAYISEFQIDRKLGIVSQEISWKACLDSQHYTGVDTATELSKAPFKIFMF